MSCLYVCATPIGNLADASDNLRQTLSRCPIIATESVQATRRLLNALQLRTPELINFREDGAERTATFLVERMIQGHQVCLVSEAGTPGISDPAWQLVMAARQAEIPVKSISGPSALTAAMAVSGLSTTQFAFLGFLPHKSSSRRQMLEQAKQLYLTSIFFESPHRLRESLEDIATTWGPQQRVILVKEISKLYEGQWDATVAQHLEQIDLQEARGEYVLLLPALPRENIEIDWERCQQQALDLLQAGVSKRDAARFLNRWIPLQKSQAYDLVERIAATLPRD